MLLRLEIKNYILIENLSIDFDKGLNVFTGETGAGKSIIADALEFLSGSGKMSTDIIRKGAASCVLSGIFDIGGNAPALETLKSAGYEIPNTGDGVNTEVIIRREIDNSGRSRSYINDKVCSLNFVRNFASRLVDIHGQHEQQSLLNTDFQREFLDIYGSSEKYLNKEYTPSYQKVKDLQERITAIESDIREKERLIDLLEYQIKDISSLGQITSQEELNIRETLPQMRNATRLKNLASEIYALLEGKNESGKNFQGTLDAIESAITKANLMFLENENPLLLDNALKEIAAIRPHFENLREILLEFINKSASFDESKADELISKLDKIERLKKKYNVSSVEELLKLKESYNQRLDLLKKSDETLIDLQNELKTSLRKLSECATHLTNLRRKAAESLTKKVLSELKQLSLERASFEIKLKPLPEPASYGAEDIEFYFNANPGETPRPLKDVISGGEMSRVMLALKTALALSSSISPVMIFDEIDAGLSGQIGQVVGEKFLSLSKTSQIITITHLPQIAAFASRHFLVQKTIRSSRTFTEVKILHEENERVSELARMLSGKNITDSALNHARHLLKEAIAKKESRRSSRPEKKM